MKLPHQVGPLGKTTFFKIEFQKTFKRGFHTNGVMKLPHQVGPLGKMTFFKIEFQKKFKVK